MYAARNVRTVDQQSSPRLPRPQPGERLPASAGAPRRNRRSTTTESRRVCATFAAFRLIVVIPGTVRVWAHGHVTPGASQQASVTTLENTCGKSTGAFFNSLETFSNEDESGRTMNSGKLAQLAGTGGGGGRGGGGGGGLRESTPSTDRATARVNEFP